MLKGILTVPTASPKKFTLSIFSPNNTMTHPDNQTSIDGLGLNNPDDQQNSAGYLQTVEHVGGKQGELWLDEKGRLTDDALKNGTLRYAYVGKYAIEEMTPSGDVVQFYTASFANPDLALSIEWEITSNDFLVPKGRFKDYPYYFCQDDPSDNNPDPDPHPKNLNFAQPVGLGAQDGCVEIQGVKVHYSD